MKIKRAILHVCIREKLNNLEKVENIPSDKNRDVL